MQKHGVRLIFPLALWAGLTLVSTAALSASGLTIRVQPGDWGNASARDIETVLDSVAAVLAPHFPRHASARVVVARSESGPRVLARKDPGGAYIVLLDVQDRRWDQFAYQFAHELCHVFSNYEQRAIGAEPASRGHQWFEEAVCEAVSLVALKRLASTWADSPPHAGWESYAPAFGEYAARMLGAGARPMPTLESTGTWYLRHRSALQADPYRRDTNAQLAALLAELFESTPGSLEAVGYLNLETPSQASFAAYLAAWLACCPPEQRPFVARLAGLFAEPL